MIKSKILILGGAGYLGQHLASRFAAETKYSVTIGDLIEPQVSSTSFQYVDVFNKSLVDKCISHNDIIINCTGQITNPIDTCFKINTEGIANIKDSVIRHNKKIYQISTVAIYGTSTFACEESKSSPESPYATCKAFAEFQIKSINNDKLCILRLPNLYGENQEKGLFAYLIKSFLSDKKLQFNNNGSLTRSYLHILDCTEEIFLSIEKNISGVYNLSAPEKYSLKQIIETIERIKNIKFKTEFNQTTPIENIDKICYKSFEEKIGFSPHHNLIDFVKNSFIDKT